MKLLTKFRDEYNDMSIEMRATFWFFICSILQRGIALITIPVFTRLMTTEEYGFFSTYASWLYIFSIFTTLRLDYGVFNKGITTYKNKKDVYVSTMIYITSLLCIVFFVVYFIFESKFIALTELSALVMILIGIEMVFTPIISFWSLRKRYDFQYKEVVSVTLLMTVFNALTGLVFVILSKDKALARIISCVLVDVIFGASIFVYIIKKTSFKFDITIAKFAIKFNIPLIPHYLSEYVLDQSDRVMIQKICSQTELGLYSVVYSAGMILRILISSLNSALLPWLYQSLENSLFKNIREKFRNTLILLSIPLLVFIILAPEFLKILAAPQYYAAVYVIPPVTASIYFIFLFGIYGNIEFYWDKNKFTMYVSMTSAILNLIMNWTAIPLFGYVAAAYTTLICYIILCVSHALFLEHVSKEKIGSRILDEKFIWIWSFLFASIAVLVSLIYDKIVIRYGLFSFIVLTILLKRKTLYKILKTI